MAATELSTKIHDAICTNVDRIQEEMISFLQDLVRIPTVNPPGEVYEKERS